MFLTKQLLAEMTGYKSNAGQTRWLKDNGYRFDVRGDGRPNILIDQVRERQCKKLRPSSEPNLAYLDRVG